MERLVKAFANSHRAFLRLSRSEAAFQQELVVLVLALPIAWVLADTWHGFAMLIGAVLMVMIVEVLNTAIEAACDAVSLEFHHEIQLAKDCGSLAVLMSILLAAVVWGLALLDAVNGVSV